MRIALINQFYPPDRAPTGLYLHDLACELVRRGHEVVAIASSRTYGSGDVLAAEERLDGVDVVRLPGFGLGRTGYGGRLANYTAYCAQLAAVLVRRVRADLILSLTTPPFVGLVGKMAAKLMGARHAHWIMDLYPDVMEAHGMITGVPLNALRAITRATLADASAVVTLGPAMAERAQRYVAAGTSVHWVPLWAPAELTPWPANTPLPLRTKRGWQTDRLVLLYSGNFGRGHRFDEFLQAAERLGPDGPRWVFAGDGHARPQLEAFQRHAPDSLLELLPFAPAAELREHLCSSDVHLISMDSRWEGTLLPSKLQASLAVGKPVIFVGNATQDIARWLAESEAGWIVSEGDVSGLVRAVQEAIDDGERARRAERAAAYAYRHFDRRRNMDALIALCID